VLEVKSILYDKGTVATHIINKGKYDFIIALGDDSTDEELFKAIPPSGYTIKVGCNPTNARFNIREQSQIIEILSMFSNSD
jgi:trehalose 6-phosphate synthase/phosphatase